MHAEARAATKLLADKKNLEVKVKEMLNTLEVVQNQRNELRQQLKDEKSNVVDAERRLREVEEDKENAVSAARVRPRALILFVRRLSHLTSWTHGPPGPGRMQGAGSPRGHHCGHAAVALMPDGSSIGQSMSVLGQCVW